MSGLEPLLIPALIGGASAGASLYGSSKQADAMKKSAANMPKPQEPVKMPDPDDPRVRAEKEMQMRKRRQAGGAESTDLVGGGGDAYTGSVLGG